MRWKYSNKSIRPSPKHLMSLALITLGLVLQSSPSAFAFKDSEDIDFEFDDISQEKNENHISAGGRDLGKSSYEKWNKNTICKNLQCKPHQTCIIKSENVAICISKKKFSSNLYKTSQSTTTTKQPLIVQDSEISDSEDEEEEDPRTWPESSSSSCDSCPVIKPDFVCGSDNQTYSSECRMNYHNCVHKTSSTVLCKGFCPCKDSKSDADFQKEEKMKERWNSYMSKFQNTLSKIKWPKLAGTSSPTTVPGSGMDNNSNRMNSYRLNLKNKGTDKMAEGGNKSQHKKTCNRGDLKMMGDRLLDWFSVVMSDHQKPKSHKKTTNNLKSGVCKSEVKWMFQHLDSDNDSKLSLRELYDLEHDDREQCLQPYLSDCDANRDLFLSIREWCTCFEKSKRPCMAAQERSPEGMTGAYMPQCDEDGYYRPRQCHSSVGMCWCVDKHGVEFTNTRRRGYPDCASLLKRGHHKLTPSDDDEDDSEDSYEEEEGSADKPLDF